MTTLRVCLKAAAIFCLSSTVQAANEDLKAELAKKQAELAALTGQIDAVAGPEFSVARDIQLKVKIDAIQTWGTRISAPNFTATATAIAVSGDLLYNPGHYKVWLQNLADTKAYVQLSPLNIHSVSGSIFAQSQLIAHAETRVFASAAGFTTNVFCETKPNTTSPAAAEFRIQPAIVGKVPYTLDLLKPASLTVVATCHLGGLGDLSMPFPISDLARELGRGEFDLGYHDKFVIDVPTSPPLTISLGLAAKNPSLTIDSDAVEALTDVDVTR